ncbi:hypothetical protein ABT369_38930 [Dactylosporangium sp. NPDC000244]|uniref:hypothetical protein n=1 Tax=Dactylosporangium sp. NPDC000244 TaxID=3154365 RepID=UPI00332FEC2F
MTVERRARRKPPPPPGLAPWLRNLVMITTLTGWAAVVAGYLAQGKLPDAPLLGIPGAVYLAMSPPTIRRRGKRTDDEDDS